MKRLLLILLCLPLLFSSCKKEDEEPTNNSSPSIIGAWTINTINFESDTSSYTFSPEDIDFLSGVEFTTGGIVYEEYANGSLDTNEWVIIADSLYIGEGGEDFVAKHQVTNTNLTLRGPIDENMWFATTMTINATRD